MAGFERKRGSDRGFERYNTSSLAIVAGDLLAFDRANHVVIKATSSSSIEDICGVAVETIASTDTSVLVQRVNEHEEFIAPSTNNSNTDHNYQRMVLTDENEVNNTGTDSTSDAAVFMQTGVVGAASAKKIVGKLVRVQDRA